MLAYAAANIVLPLCSAQLGLRQKPKPKGVPPLVGVGLLPEAELNTMETTTV